MIEPETEGQDIAGFWCTPETSYSGRGVCGFSQFLQGSVETQPAEGGKMGDEVNALKEQMFFSSLNKF